MSCVGERTALSLLVQPKKLGRANINQSQSPKLPGNKTVVFVYILLLSDPVDLKAFWLFLFLSFNRENKNEPSTLNIAFICVYIHVYIRLLQQTCFVNFNIYKTGNFVWFPVVWKDSRELWALVVIAASLSGIWNLSGINTTVIWVVYGVYQSKGH